MFGKTHKISKVPNRVYVQNQFGPHPTKWDKSGVVVEVEDNDQYLIKIAGSGRLTLRNRRFLRQFTLPSTTIGTPLHAQYSAPMTAPSNHIQGSQHNTCSDDNMPNSTSSSPLPASNDKVLKLTGTSPLSASSDPPILAIHEPPAACVLPVHPPTPASHHTDLSPPTGNSTKNDTAMHAHPAPMQLVEEQPTSLSPVLLRPIRNRRPRQHYVPETGMWGSHSP